MAAIHDDDFQYFRFVHSVVPPAHCQEGKRKFGFTGSGAQRWPAIQDCAGIKKSNSTNQKGRQHDERNTFAVGTLDRGGIAADSIYLATEQAQGARLSSFG